MTSETFAYDGSTQTLASPLIEPEALSGEAPMPYGEIRSPFGEAPKAYPGESMADEGPTWGHLWTDWLPVFRPEQESETIALENQSAPPQPKLTTTFPPEAVAELPAVMQAKPMISLEATVPTERILWMIAGARANRSAEPGWADRLLVDLADLPKATPSATVHVAVVQTVPAIVGQDVLTAFHRFCVKAHPTKEPPYDALSVGVWSNNRWLEERLNLSAGSLGRAAGLPTQMSVDQAATYQLVVYALLPRTVGMVVAPRDQRSLRGFDFAKSTLTAEHERLLDSLAREIVHSWHSRRIVKRIVVDGHTDPVGTREYNLALGRRRADAVAARLKQLINTDAGRLPAGTVESIEYVVASYGEDRPFSTRLNTLNRRVELTVFRDYSPPPKPLDLDITITRLTTLLSTSTDDPDTVRRLQCLLQKIRQSGHDDRYANETQVFLMKSRNTAPGPTEWNHVLSLILEPSLFGPQVADDQARKNLRWVDEEVAGGIVKMNQIIAYASGADYGLGLISLSSAFKQFNAWVLERLRDPLSIYSCYADLFL